MNSSYLNNLLCLLLVLLLISCGSDDTVSGGFGSETSTGIVLTVASAGGSSSPIEYEVLRSDFDPTNTSTQFSLTDTLIPGIADTILLDVGKYSVFYEKSMDNQSGLTQHVEVVEQVLTEVVDTVKNSGILNLQLPPESRIKELQLFVRGTRFVYRVDDKLIYDSLLHQCFIPLPEGHYSGLHLLDERDSSITENLLTDIEINADSMTIRSIDEQLWPDPDKSDGWITVNWYYSDTVSIVGNDTITTQLIPLDFNPYVDSLDSRFENIKITSGGAVTFMNIPYGLYNLTVTSSATDMKKALSVIIENNQNMIVQDTLQKGTRYSYPVHEDEVIENAFLSGTTIVGEVQTDSVVFNNVPVGAKGRVSFSLQRDSDRVAWSSPIIEIE